MAGLTSKQQAFVRQYLACHNGAAAARLAGYAPKRADQIAYENLRKPEIKTAIQEAILEIMPPAEAVQRLADQARSSMADFLEVAEEEVTVYKNTFYDDEAKAEVSERMTAVRPVARLNLLKSPEKHHLIKKYSLDDKGKVAIELYDAHAALVDIGRMHGLFVDKHEVTGADGTPLFPDFEKALKKTYAPPDDNPDPT